MSTIHRHARVPAFEMPLVVTFADTNAVGNVYFASYFRWQGLARERFLHEHAPDVLARIGGSDLLVTVGSSCDFVDELVAFDTVLVRMYATEAVQNRLTLRFEFVRQHPDGREDLVARGEQTVAWVSRDATGTRPTPVPEDLVAAIRRAVASYRPAATERGIGAA